MGFSIISQIIKRGMYKPESSYNSAVCSALCLVIVSVKDVSYNPHYFSVSAGAYFY